MKRFKIHPGFRNAGMLFLFAFVSCTANQKPKETSADNDIFPKGQKAPSEYFTGTAWVYGLVRNDSIFTTLAGNVTFEPSARTHWHSHPAGQILIVTSGIGYHQIEGGPKEIIKKGDVVKCPPNKLENPVKLTT